MKRAFVAMTGLAALVHAGCAATTPGAQSNGGSTGPEVAQLASTDALEAGFQQLTTRIVAELNDKQATRIAVVPFQNLDGAVTEFGVFVAEEMTTRLYQAGTFRVIEREMLQRVMEEHELATTGLIDEATAKELGKLLGVDAIATGSVTDLGKEVRVNSRLISTETGSVFSAAAVTLPKDDRIRILQSHVLVTPGARRGQAGGAGAGGTSSRAAVDGSGADHTGGGKELVLLSSRSNNSYVWAGGSPYVTTLKTLVDGVAFIPTGNNHFNKRLAAIGYEAGEARYISFWVYLMKEDGWMLFQSSIGGKFDHRWRIDGRPNYGGAWGNWPAMGQMVNLPINQWVEVRLDLINDLGGKPGQFLDGLAFSSTSGDVIYDKVVLIMNSD